MFETKEQIPDFLREVCYGLHGVRNSMRTSNIISIPSSSDVYTTFEYDETSGLFVFKWSTIDIFVDDSSVNLWEDLLEYVNINLLNEETREQGGFFIDDEGGIALLFEISYDEIKNVDFCFAIEFTVSGVKDMCESCDYIYSGIIAFSEVKEKNEETLWPVTLLLNCETTGSA